MAVNIRLLRAGEESVLVNVGAEVFDYAVERSLSSTFLNDPRHHIVVAIDDDLVVGFASGVHYIHPDKPPQLFINEVGVAPSHRQQGIGRAVLHRLLERGRELGCTEAWVLTEYDNVAARRLYASENGQEKLTPSLMYDFPFNTQVGDTEERRTTGDVSSQFMVIREATLHDVSNILAIDPIGHQHSHGADFVIRSVASSTCLVAERDSIVGYGVLEHSFFEQGFISMLFVAQAARRQRVGTTLMDAMAARCRTRKLFTSTNESNRPMQALLDRMGYVRSGIIENLDPDDPEWIYFFQRPERSIA